MKTSYKPFGLRSEQRVNQPTGEVLSGDQEITGTISSVENKFTQFGNRPVMWVASGRRKYYGTVPKALRGCHAGDVVTFTAAVNPMIDDKFAGFYKKPRLARKLR